MRYQAPTVSSIGFAKNEVAEGSGIDKTSTTCTDSGNHGDNMTNPRSGGAYEVDE